MLRLEYKRKPGGWRVVEAELHLINGREPRRREETARKSQESMRNIKAIAVRAYSKGSKRRRAVPVEKAGWRGMLGCERGR